MYRAWPQWSSNTASWAGVGRSRYRDMRTYYRMTPTFPGEVTRRFSRPEGRSLYAAILMDASRPSPAH